MTNTLNIVSFVTRSGKKVALLLPLFMLYILVFFLEDSYYAFHWMARWSEPFSLTKLIVGTLEQGPFFQSVLQSMVGASFWQYKICLVLSLLFWWRKPTGWRYALVLFLASLSYLYCYEMALEWYGETLVEHPEYRQMLPTWFPPTPGRLFSAFINLF